MSDPLQLAVVKQDDELLDRLGQGLSAHEHDDDTARLLLDWRADIFGQLPVVDRLETAAPPALPLLRRRMRLPRPSLRLAGAAAGLVGVLSSLGVGAAASKASPDSVLFPLTKVVASQHAESVQARDDVWAALQLAERQAAAGDTAGARLTLAAAQRRVADVRPEDGRDALRAQVRAAQSKLRTPPAPAASPTGGPAAGLSPTVAPGPPSPAAQSSPEPGPNPESTPDPAPAPTPSP